MPETPEEPVSIAPTVADGAVPSSQEELNERVNAFVKDYGQLVLKHKIDFATYPMFVPDGNGGFKIVCQNTPVDIGNQPLRSPFIS